MGSGKWGQTLNCELKVLGILGILVGILVRDIGILGQTLNCELKGK